MFNWIKGKSKKAVCLVAHPDDCVIFAQAFISEHKNLDWSIVYLTHDADSERGMEISNYWRQQNITTYFLGFQDRIPLVSQNETVAVLSKLIELELDFKLVLTHNAVGETKHVHHVLLNTVSQNLPCPKVYFGCGFLYNHSSPPPRDVVPKLPLHEEVIGKFDVAVRCKYFIDDKAKEIL